MINLEKFNEEVNKIYNLFKCQFSVFPSTWKSLFKKLLSNTGLFNIDYILKNIYTEDKYIIEIYNIV